MRITPNFYEEKRKEYRGKQKTINDKIAKLHTADEEYYLTAEYVLKLATKASELFESSEPQEKRLLLKMTLQDLVLDGKYIRFKWIKPFDKIAYYASRNAWLENRNSNITMQLACIIKAFSDFRLVAQIRKEVDNVKTVILENHLPKTHLFL